MRSEQEGAAQQRPSGHHSAAQKDSLAEGTCMQGMRVPWSGCTQRMSAGEHRGWQVQNNVSWQHDGLHFFNACTQLFV